MRKLAVLGFVFGATIAAAQSPTPDLHIADLSRCDSKFFQSLAGDRKSMERLAPLAMGKDHAAFVVPDRKDPRGKSEIIFAQPVDFMGLKIVGYFDEQEYVPFDQPVDVSEKKFLGYFDGESNYSLGMMAYSWGYLVAGSVERIATTLKPVISDSVRLRRDGPIYVRTELWDHGSASPTWAKIDTEANSLRPGTVERALMIEAIGRAARVGCSIQGNITKAMLQDLRPDLVR